MGIAQDVYANLPRVPPRDHTQSANPITLFGMLTPLTWGFFLSGWLSWTCDAMDFFAVSLSVPRLAIAFAVTPLQITTSITLTLLFRPVGAVIFGLMSDRFGRKWPLSFNLVLVAVLSLSTAYTDTFQQFLAVRALFGIAMGGIWGGAITTALENMPVPVRGLASGILQQGYAFGYLIAAVINLTLVAQLNRYQILFQVAAALSLFAAGVRLLLPESQFFLDRRAAEIANNTLVSSGDKSRIFISEAGRALKLHWRRCVFAILLMTGFNFFSHGSQDQLSLILTKAKGLPASSATIIIIIGNCGAITGGLFSGYISQLAGRRLTIIGCCVWTLCFLPLWLLPTSFSALAAGSFFLQMGVQGAWGVVPIYLTEISPTAFRASFPAVAYQIGNMISSSAAAIETAGGDNLKSASGLPDYGRVATILIGVVAGWIILLCLLGREDLGAQFELSKAAYETGAGNDEKVIDGQGNDVDSNGEVNEKGSVSEHSDEEKR